MDLLLAKVKASTVKLLSKQQRWVKRGFFGLQPIPWVPDFMLSSESSLVLDEKLVPAVSQNEVLVLNFALYPEIRKPLLSHDFSGRRTFRAPRPSLILIIFSLLFWMPIMAELTGGRGLQWNGDFSEPTG